MNGNLKIDYLEPLVKQLAYDYCCGIEDVIDTKNHFTILLPRELH